MKTLLTTGQKQTETIELRDFDPTILLRLHSILSKKDIFTLKSRYNYKLKWINDETVSLEIPDDMIKICNSLNNEDFHDLIKNWYLSTEVAINGWGIKKTQKNFVNILNLCKTAK